MLPSVPDVVDEITTLDDDQSKRLISHLQAMGILTPKSLPESEQPAWWPADVSYRNGRTPSKLVHSSRMTVLRSIFASSGVRSVWVKQIVYISNSVCSCDTG